MQMQPGRLQNTELVVPIIVGTVSQHLGKKVSSVNRQNNLEREIRAIQSRET
jgi:uncharacterized membrane-anchored protein YhcB (DUF1043 family)